MWKRFYIKRSPYQPHGELLITELDVNTSIEDISENFPARIPETPTSTAHEYTLNKNNQTQRTIQDKQIPANANLEAMHEGWQSNLYPANNETLFQECSS